MDKIVNRRGEKEPFDERKVYASVYAAARQSGYDEKKAETLAEEISKATVKWIKAHKDKVVTSQEIREEVISLLKEKDKDVSFMYDKYLDLLE